jgi:hypothetical protein
MNLKDGNKLTPVKLHKFGDVALPTTSLGKAVAAQTTAEAAPKHEPQARLVEVQPGIYDIMVTCSCGEQMIVRCESVTGPSGSGPTHSSATPSSAMTNPEAPTPPSASP